MAKYVQSKKRKASVPESDAGKTKKVKKVTTEATAPLKKRKATEDAAPVAVKKSKTPMPDVKDAPKSKPAKKDITSDKSTEQAKGTVVKGDKSAAKELKAAKATKTKEIKHVHSPEEDNDEEVEDEDDDDDDESEVDDQTEALLKGFESDGDEEDAEKEGGLKEGQEVPGAPKMSKKQKKQIQEAADDKPGVVYVGRIPHGFYEHEMREYFKQFGNILKLRLSRNRKTGASKHVAWIQFESSVVADIVAKTMDNYLLFNHILKVKVVPDEQVSPNLFKGANKRFKKVPWNKIDNRKLAQPKTEEAWGKVNAREQSRRAKKAEKLKEMMGYEFEAPALKSAQGLGKKVAKRPALTEGEAEVKAIEAAPATEEGGSQDEAVEATKAASEATASTAATE